jgi:hypothetical protein
VVISHRKHAYDCALRETTEGEKACAVMNHWKKRTLSPVTCGGIKLAFRAHAMKLQIRKFASGNVNRKMREEKNLGGAQ